MSNLGFDEIEDLLCINIQDCIAFCVAVFVTEDCVVLMYIQVCKQKMMLSELIVHRGMDGSSGNLNEKKESLTKQEISDILKYGAENLFKDDEEGQGKQSSFQIYIELIMVNNLNYQNWLMLFAVVFSLYCSKFNQIN